MHVFTYQIDRDQKTVDKALNETGGKVSTYITDRVHWIVTIKCTPIKWNSMYLCKSIRKLCFDLEIYEFIAYLNKLVFKIVEWLCRYVLLKLTKFKLYSIEKRQKFLSLNYLVLRDFRDRHLDSFASSGYLWFH